MYLRDSNLARKILKTYNVSDDNYSLYTVINYISVLCFFSHSLFLIAFFALNIVPLALFNILSCLTYIIIFFVNRRGRHNLALGIGATEVVSHSILASLFLGWGSGFHYFILCVVPLVFFSPIINKVGKSVINIIFAILYIYLYNFSSTHSPVYNLEPIQVAGFNHLNILITFSAFSLLAYYFRWAEDKAAFILKQANKKLEVLAETDFLTGLVNRRKMIEEVGKSINKFRNDRTTFSIIMCDIDNFKIFNDQYGHNCGDLVLTTSAAIMKSQLIENAVISRWGGEEFLILLPESSLDKTLELAERLRKSVQDTTILYNEKKVSITMTFGIYTYNSEVTLEEAVNYADKALYSGKRKGRNCVVA